MFRLNEQARMQKYLLRKNNLQEPRKLSPFKSIYIWNISIIKLINQYEVSEPAISDWDKNNKHSLL